MSELSRRIQRLEAEVGPATHAVGSAPAAWSPEERERAVRDLAAAQGATGEFETLIFEERDPEVREASVSFIGDLGELFDHIARTGRRLGDVV